MNRRPENGNPKDQIFSQVKQDNRDTTTSIFERLNMAVPGIQTDGLVEQNGVLVGNTTVEGIASYAELSYVIKSSFKQIFVNADLDDSNHDIDPETKAMAREILSRIKDSTIVDLGAGISNDIYESAKELKASTYIGVEPLHFAELNNSLKNSTNPLEQSSDNETSAIVVAENMLSFLKRLPDDSATVIASNIDLDVIGNKELAIQIGNEIDRVVGRKNIYYTNFSTIPLPNGKKYKVRNFDPNLPKVETVTSNNINLSLQKMRILIKE